jgi:hypothetical protein
LRLCNRSLLRKAELARLLTTTMALIIKQQPINAMTLVVVVDLRLN